MDAARPGGGLSRGVLHEVAAGAAEGACVGEDAAAAGFSAMLLGRFARGRPVLWCENRTARERSGLPGTIYAPGIAAFGIAPEDLILARTRRDAEALWTAEEALRSEEHTSELQ